MAARSTSTGAAKASAPQSTPASAAPTTVITAATTASISFSSTGTPSFAQRPPVARRSLARRAGCVPGGRGVKSVSMSQDKRQPMTAIGQETPRTPADRVRLIQEMQRAAETQQVHAPVTQPTAQATQAQGAQQTAQAQRAPDLFGVKQVNAVQQALQAKPTSTEVNAYAKAQASAQALFGGSTDIEVTGNPWKIIPFGDVLPGLFDTDKPLSEYTPVVPEKAVKTEQGLLFEIGLKDSREESAPVQKRAVLVGADGKLAGAECRTPQQAQKLLAAAPWLLPESAAGKDSSWRVTQGQGSAFTLQVDRSSGRGRTTEALPLTNFARLADARGKSVDLQVAQYFLDRFDAAV